MNRFLIAAALSLAANGALAEGVGTTPAAPPAPATGTLPADPNSSSTPGIDAGVSATINTTVFGKLDANRDGKLSRAETQADTATFAQFETLDANRDGAVSSGEFRASATPATKK